MAFRKSKDENKKTAEKSEPAFDLAEAEGKKLDPQIQDVIEFLEATLAHVPDFHKEAVKAKIKELKG